MIYYRNLNHDAYSFSLAGMSVTASAAPYAIVPSDGIANARDARHTPKNAGERRKTWLFGLVRRFAWGTPN